MAKMNVWKRLFPVRTHEGAVAQKVDAKSELRRAVLTCLLWEDTLYEKGSDIAKRITALAAETKPEAVAALAREARDKLQLRHAPLFLVRELARRKGAGTLVAERASSSRSTGRRKSSRFPRVSSAGWLGHSRSSMLTSLRSTTANRS